MQWASTKYFNQDDFLGRSVTIRIGKGKTRDPETGWEASVLVPIRLTAGLEQDSVNLKVKQMCLKW